MWNIIHVINLQMHVEWIAKMLMDLQRNASLLLKMFGVSFSFDTIETAWHLCFKKYSLICILKMKVIWNIIQDIKES